MSNIVEDRRNYGRKGGTFTAGQPCWYAATPDDSTPIRKAWFKHEAKLGDTAVAGLTPIKTGKDTTSWFFWFVCASTADLPPYAMHETYAKNIVYVPCRKGVITD